MRDFLNIWECRMKRLHAILFSKLHTDRYDQEITVEYEPISSPVSASTYTDSDARLR